MTNREYIRTKHRLPPAIARWLQPFFNFDLGRVPMEIGNTWSYGETRKAVAPNGHVRINKGWLATCTNNDFLQIIGHELYHVSEWKRQGWLSHLLERIFRPRKKGEWYSHDIIPEEREADALRHRIYVWLAANAGWENLLEESV